MDGLNAFVPSGVVRRRSRFRPIALRKFGRDMLWIAAEFEDVPLRDADVLQQLPRGVRQSLRRGDAVVRWKIRQGIGESEVSLAASQELNQMCADGRIRL